MTEEEARRWIADAVSRETFARIAQFVLILETAAAQQNLIAASTIDHIWSRHLVDSAQLDSLIAPGPILDVGAGAGFPGMIIAMLRDDPISLVEPRRLRAGFLTETATALGLAHVTVVQRRVETLAAPPFATILARAVAPLPKLLAMAEHLADAATRWVLPKGRTAQSELAAARETWHGDFRMVDSASDAEAAIIVATGVRRKAKRGKRA